MHGIWAIVTKSDMFPANNEVIWETHTVYIVQKSSKWAMGIVYHIHLPVICHDGLSNQLTIHRGNGPFSNFHPAIEIYESILVICPVYDCVKTHGCVKLFQTCQQFVEVCPKVANVPIKIIGNNITVSGIIYDRN